MDKNKPTLTLDSDLTLSITLTVKEWAFAVGVLKSAVEMGVSAGKNAGGMPDEIAHIVASADKLAHEITEHPDLDKFNVMKL